MRNSFLVVAYFLWSSLCSGQQIREQRVIRQIQKIPQFNNAFVGVHVERIEHNKTVASVNGKRYMTPASNTKLLTFLGAVQTFSSLPALAFSSENNRSIHFKSTGYPLLLHPFYPDSTLIHFFEDKKNLEWKYHPAETAPESLGSGWSWDDYNYYYAAPRSVFPIYGNSVRGVMTANGPGLTPSFETAQDTTLTALERTQFANRFHYNPQNWKRGDTLYRPFIPSDSLFMSLLGGYFNKTISNVVQKQDSLHWEFLNTSHEEVLYKGLLQDSDNGIAEALLLMIANQQQAIFRTQAAIDSLQKRWAPWLPDPLEWVDGSGVSRYNMITPRTLVAVLKQITNVQSWEKIEILFPKSGLSGTLKAYPDLENVYAKTGTLRHNHNLSGYWISSQGNHYAFSIMVNHFTASTTEIRRGISELLLWFQKKLN
jgi:D-alanyl-D-alanine carboxypeptidase/D-alanyl-D-alanine-endopeptidase (penicillin-binding protein 4)